MLHRAAFLQYQFGSTVALQHSHSLPAVLVGIVAMLRLRTRPAFGLPRGVPRRCCFRLGDVRGCGAKVHLDGSGPAGPFVYRFCPITEWMMCPACFNKMPNLGEDEERWRHEVHKDHGVCASSSSASTLPRASAKVKRVLKKPASL
jgi:hypothetical protein